MYVYIHVCIFTYTYIKYKPFIFSDCKIPISCDYSLWNSYSNMHYFMGVNTDLIDVYIVIVYTVCI